MRQIILIISILTLFSCSQSDTKQKELELKERELALKEKEFENKEETNSTNAGFDTSKSSSVVKKLKTKCDTKQHLLGKLDKVDFEEWPCVYAFLKITADDGKQLELYLDENLDKFQIGGKKLFKWSDKKIFAKLDNMGNIPNEAIDMSLIGNSYVFCCYKQQLNCGDDPNAAKQYFCKKIMDQ